MKTKDYEELVINVVLEWSDNKDIIAKTLDLNVDDFREERKIVFEAILDCIMAGNDPSIANVIKALGKQIDSIGGSDYLHVISSKLDQFAIWDVPIDTFSDYTGVVAAGGTFRRLESTLDKAKKSMSDIDKLALNHSSDPGEFIGNIVDKLAVLTKGGTRNLNYRPISEAMAEARLYANRIREGSTDDFIIDIGWPSWKKYSIPRPSTYVAVSGLSSIGKTQLVLQMASGASICMKSKEEKGVVVIHEYEQTSLSLATRLTCCMAGLDSMRLDAGSFTSDEYRRYDKMAEILSYLPIEFSTETGLTRTQVGNKLKALNVSSKGPIKLAVIDYPELQADQDATEELRVSAIARYYQELSRSLNTCLIGVYQYPKPSNTAMLGGYAGERYSAGIYQSSDINLEIYNLVAMKAANIQFKPPKDFNVDSAYIIIKKNRDRGVGIIEMEWEPRWTRFTDPLSSTFGSNVYDVSNSWMANITPDF